MNNYEIKPILLNSKKMNEFYEYLLNIGYAVKIWNRKKDENVYDFFLPIMRDYIFWTFNFGKSTKFAKMSNEMQSAVCSNYSSTTFEGKNEYVVCFATGIAFYIKQVSEDKKGSRSPANKVFDFKWMENLQEININKTQKYTLETDNLSNLFNYVISLYKFVMLSKLNKAMESEDKFDKNRKVFVTFVQEIYSQKITDDAQGIKQSAKWDKALGTDKLYIAVENKFDLLYRNSKLNEHNSMFRIIIILLVVLIIIGTINLMNWFI